MTALVVLSWNVAHAADAAGDSGFRPLVTEETLSQWTMEGEPTMSFRFEEGELVGQPTVNEPKSGFLCSPVEFKDFTLKAEFKITPPDLNSGIQFRSAVRADGVVAGPQLEHALNTSFVNGFSRARGLRSTRCSTTSRGARSTMGARASATRLATEGGSIPGIWAVMQTSSEPRASGSFGRPR